MKDNINKLKAEALVQQGYAKGVLKLSGEYRIYVGEAMGSTMDVSVDPFADTLEGRRQADALEDWLTKYHNRLWAASSLSILTDRDTGNYHQWRLDRIKWCFEQLAEKSHD